MTDNTVQWKKKYYDGLDKMERREKEWKNLEYLFKQVISRLSLAAEGRNKSLDRTLNNLRTTIREGKDNKIIESVLENVSKELIKLDRQKKYRPAGDSGFLLKVINHMSLQGRADKKAAKLIKKLNAKNPPEQAELVKLFTDLLTDVVEQSILENEEKDKSGGFFKNLFSGGKEYSEKEANGKEPSASGESLVSSAADSQGSEILRLNRNN